MTMTSQVERPGLITMQGNPLTLVGQELKVGDRIPDFHVQTADTLQTVGWDDLSENGTKAVLMILIPSIDTNVCALETSKFNRQVATLPTDKIKVVTMSADTPFAQARWAKEEGVNNIQMLSDHKDRTVGEAFGAQIKELGLLSRSGSVTSAVLASEESALLVIARVRAPHDRAHCIVSRISCVSPD